MFTQILLCTHGSEGAQKAEKFVFAQLLENNPPPKLTILTIVDKDWSLMTGDDWLNTSKTRNTFIGYVEEQMGREIEEDWQRIKVKFPAAADVRFMKVVGGIEETMAEVAEKLECDLIVIGPYQKKPRRLTSLKMAPGLAARLSNEKLHPLLTTPLLVVPA
jgi:nucleotide-binding universal stress UspA family protein